MENPIHCFLEKSSDNIWKSIHYLLSAQWQHMENYTHCLLKRAVPIYGKPHPFFFLKKNSESTWKITYTYTAWWNKQWHVIKIHPLLIKCAVTTHGKPYLLLFKRVKWQNLENQIHRLVKQQWQHLWKYIQC